MEPAWRLEGELSRRSNLYALLALHPGDVVSVVCTETFQTNMWLHCRHQVGGETMRFKILSSKAV
jgi:hypothetical protein